MAKGVSQDDIHQAADALLATGERPTVERIRLALGRGSPNTIGPMLDGWWAKLAERLAQQLALPGLPDTVGTAFARAWEAALHAGKAYAETAVAPERAALADALSKADAAAAAHQAATTALESRWQQAQATTKGVEAALAISDQRVNDLIRQVADQQASLQHVTVRRDAVEARLGYIQIEHQKERAAITAERDALQAHVRQAEDRAYGEVDRGRQELKAMKAQLTTQAREHAAALRQSDQALRTAQAALTASQRQSARFEARIAVLATRKATRHAPRTAATAKAAPASARRTTKA